VRDEAVEEHLRPYGVHAQNQDLMSHRRRWMLRVKKLRLAAEQSLLPSSSQLTTTMPGLPPHKMVRFSRELHQNLLLVMQPHL